MSPTKIIEDDHGATGPWPAPRFADEILGHESAEAAFLQSYHAGKLAHAWLISGAPGIGKATLAYRMARFLLSENERAEGFIDTPPVNLNVSADSHAARQIAARSHPNLLVLSRPINPKTKKLQTILPVSEVRKIGDFFGMTAGEKTWRVCIVDTADDMNASAANALLKTLEEPPEKSVLLLVANMPGRLLPTIRSRCRTLALSSIDELSVSAIITKYMPDLSKGDVATLAKLAQGSPGRGLLLAHHNGAALYKDVIGVLQSLPTPDPLAVLDFGTQLARPGNEEAYNITFEMLYDWLHRMILNCAQSNGTQASDTNDVVAGEGDLMRSLGRRARAEHWVEVWQNLHVLHRRSQALYLDRKQTIVQAFQSIQAVCKP